MLLATAAAEGKDMYLTTIFILGADRKRYGRYLEDLHNSYLQGNNKYPNTLVSVYNTLNGWKDDHCNYVSLTGSANDRIHFAMTGRDGKPLK